MSLRSKIVVLLLAVVVLYGLTDFFVQRTTIAPTFDRVDSSEAIKDIQRVKHALKTETDELARDCKSLASWRATWNFALDRDPDFVELNLGPSAFERLDLDLIYISTPEGEVLWGGTRDSAWEPMIDLPRILSDAVVLTRAYTTESNGGAEREGYVPRIGLSGMRATKLGPVLLCTRPITESTEGLLARGAVTVGRLLDQDLIDELIEKTKVDFDLWAIDDPQLPASEAQLLNEVTSSYEPLVEQADASRLYVYSSHDDMASVPAFLLRVTAERTVGLSGATALNFAWNSTVVAGLLMLMALVLVLQKIVLRPLSMLTRHVEAIGRTEDVHAKLELLHDDELGILAREFNSLMEKLAQSRADLVTAAREAGMSEIATGILHNVGNTLNSVNVSAALLANTVHGLSGPKDLNAVIEVLQQHAEDLPTFIGSEQGSHLSPFLSNIAGSLDAAVVDIVSEVESLTNGIEHIRELIQSQQNFAGRSSLVESLRPVDLIKEAFLICERAVAADPGLTTVHEIEDLPRLMLDRHKVLEILVNLIQNARQAMNAAGIADRRIVLRAHRIELDAEVRLVMEVTDNGVGIDHETAEKIFNMGFTTKKDGHGFGLHAAANSATEMNGRLTVHSGGLGTGATFRLELPYEAARVASPQL